VLFRFQNFDIDFETVLLLIDPVGWFEVWIVRVWSNVRDWFVYFFSTFQKLWVLSDKFRQSGKQQFWVLFC